MSSIVITLTVQGDLVLVIWKLENRRLLQIVRLALQQSYRSIFIF